MDFDIKPMHKICFKAVSPWSRSSEKDSVMEAVIECLSRSSLDCSKVMPEIQVFRLIMAWDRHHNEWHEVNMEEI